jgi:signal transduction histidine kinase
MNAIDRSIHTQIEYVEFYATNTALRRLVQESNRKFTKLKDIQGYIDKQDAHWRSVDKKQTSPFMRGLIDNELSEELRGIVKFHEERNGYRVFGEIFVTNKYGANCAQTQKTSDYYQADEQWWQQTKEDGLYVGDVEYDESIGAYSVTIASRVNDEAGNFIGIEKAVVDIKDVVNTISRVEATAEYEDIKFKLLNKNEEIIYATDDFEFLQGADAELISYIKNIEKDGEHFTSTSAIDGEKGALFGHIHAKSYRGWEGTGWTLLIECKTKKIFASIWELKRYILAVSLVIVMVGILMGFYISSSISRPITKFKDAAVEVGKGNLDIRIEGESNSEIGQLIGSFNKMIDDLHSTTTSVKSLKKEITERERAEQAVKDAYAELEKTNKELGETQAQLVQNEKLASIGQLAAGVAHEMNTPVGFVASNFQTLEKYVGKIKDLLEMYGQLGKEIEASGQEQLSSRTSAINESREDMQVDFILEDIKGLFNDSKEGLERVTTIIQNLRDFSRIDQASSFDECSINDGIKATLVVAKNEVKYDTEVKLELSEVPKIYCHTSQLNQVFLNIIMNASQAIKTQERKEKGAITIKTYATAEHVVCEIADDGPGIAPENLSKILDPFFTTKPAGKGTGLGLSVSHDIVVNKHKGELLVDSTVGKGTKFTIKLPIHREDISDGEGIEDYEGQESVVCDNK